MKLLDKILNTGAVKVQRNTNQANKNHQIIEQSSTGFSRSSDVVTSDIIRSCIRPKVVSAGKLEVAHLVDDEVVNDKRIMLLLKEPNEVDSMQSLLEKLTTQLELNNNAYAVISRDKEGFPISIEPILTTSATMVKSNSGHFYFRFLKKDGTTFTKALADTIHLKQEHNALEHFGQNPETVLSDLLKSIDVIDDSVEQAIKNSTNLRWLLKFHGALAPETVKQRTEEFKQSFLGLDNNGGVGASDGSYDLERIKQDIFVPDTKVQEEAIKRIYNYFGVSEEIVDASFNEDEWASYYELQIEPLIVQLSNEFTRKVFSRLERMQGNKLIFTSAGLQFASMESKIKLTELLDRSVLTPNETRHILNLPSIEGGDEPLRRLDTALASDERFHNTTDNKEGIDDDSKGGEDN